MTDFVLPAGQYFSVSGRIHPGSGGQTRALLLRNRLFAQRAGIEPVLLCLDDAPNYPQIRQTFIEQGQLVAPMRLLNLFEWHRDNPVDDLEPVAGQLPEIEGFDVDDVRHPDGTIYQTRYLQRHGGQPVVIDYRRPDGSVFLRVPAGPPSTSSPATDVLLVNGKGDQVGRWPTQRGWRKNWILSLLQPDQRAFLFCDSRFAIADIMPLADPRLHVVHLMHNVHQRPPYLWSSPVSPEYRPLLSNSAHLDALVTLTERQSQDVADRFGATANLFVVPNPVEEVPATNPAAPAAAAEGRGRMRFAVVTRLEKQKRIEDAIAAFALVLKQEPDATLEIYGEGRLRAFLTEQIESLGVQESVRLMGYRLDAQATLRTATAMLLTSRFDGYPLATLESLSHGCPVIGYDIKYGPREQISHQVDGFLVEPGNVRELADRIVQLIRDPDLAGRLSAAARQKAAQHDYRSFLTDWQSVLEQVVANRPYRSRISAVDVEVSRLGYLRSHRLPSQYARTAFLRRLTGRRAASAGFRTAPRMEFAGRLRVRGTSERSTLDDVRFSLDAVCEASGSITALPLQVQRSGDWFRLTSNFDPAVLFAAVEPQAQALQLRLRLVWQNCSWQTMLARPRRLAPNYELSYSDTGDLTLLRGPQRS